MTLLLVVASPEHTVVLSDRRLTSGSSIAEDKANKATIVHTSDAKFCLVFTGLAECGSFSTERWLCEQLPRSAERFKSAQNILFDVSDALTEQFQSHSQLKRLNARDRKLTIACAGYLHTGSRISVLISNFENPEAQTFVDEALDKFEIFAQIDGEAETRVHYYGATAAVRSADRDDIRALVANKKPREAIREKAISLMHDIADREGSQCLIGKDLLVVSLSPNPNTSPSSYYAPYGADQVIMGANQVDLVGEVKISLKNLKLEFPGSQGIIVRKVGRNARCPCGSGSKYKHCHGR